MQPIIARQKELKAYFYELMIAICIYAEEV